MLEEFGALPAAEGFERVYYPGEPEDEMRKLRAVKGIPIDPGLRRQLVALGERLGVSTAGF
jgi:LDH2 family malate/lactate/ureidoglycolate dehydrogenase